jgi:hypothetical protein
MRTKPLGNALGAGNETSMKILERAHIGTDPRKHLERQRSWGEFQAMMKKAKRNK